MESDCEGLDENNPEHYNKFVDRYFDKFWLKLRPKDERELLEKEHQVSGLKKEIVLMDDDVNLD